ncbi:predicted protein [Sclerotinia sclerotiorum 1980 UF-70]|uniref:Uncharacterized protein n=1 Tax=Sclerotinia sclerotiorum (strain ATCC 18683 / 1980 / Ss-1) TaxID=665079 RepID=A7F0Q9_SCLS1|nr:predicted protein [Sclerotinia sclerotiorum 1980 UF-70]EDN95301.1 predicted protein [Sclerotinia sclerotiorum 1980 UF-70]
MGFRFQMIIYGTPGIMHGVGMCCFQFRARRRKGRKRTAKEKEKEKGVTD